MIQYHGFLRRIYLLTHTDTYMYITNRIFVIIDMSRKYLRTFEENRNQTRLYVLYILASRYRVLRETDNTTPDRLGMIAGDFNGASPTRRR